MPPVPRAKPNHRAPFPILSALSRDPAMDRTIREEMNTTESLLLDCLSSGQSAAFVRRWESTSRRLSSAIQEGWLSDATLDVARKLASKVMAIAGNLARAEETAGRIQEQVRIQCRDHLASARRPPPFSPRRHSLPPSDPFSSPPTSLALSELNASRPLRLWFLTHLAHPWPTPSEKAGLAAESSIPAKRIADWFTNTRRRSGWNAFQKRWAHSNRDEVRRIVRDLDQPRWAAVNVDERARDELERVRAYFGERERVDEDVRVVVDGMATMPLASVGAGDTPCVPGDTFFESAPRRPSSFATTARVVSSASADSDESTQRSVSASSSLLSYSADPLDYPPTTTFSGSPPSFALDPFLAPATLAYPSQPGDIPVSPLPLADDSFARSPSPSPSAALFEPSPFFSTLAEHPYAMHTDLWTFDLGPVGGYDQPRRASD